MVDESSLDQVRDLAPCEVKKIGDTKYDRAIQHSPNSLIKEKVESLHRMITPSLRIILGSAWPKDIELICSTLDAYLQPWSLIVAPHEITNESLNLVERWALKNSYSCIRSSHQRQNTDDTHQILIVDEIGLLTSLYKGCDLALVGGALHNKVHNVLEPAALGLPICFGPLYTNSHEACDLVERKLAKVVHSPEDMLHWLEKFSTPLEQDKHRAAIDKFLKERCGATKALLERIAQS